MRIKLISSPHTSTFQLLLLSYRGVKDRSITQPRVILITQLPIVSKGDYDADRRLGIDYWVYCWVADDKCP